MLWAFALSDKEIGGGGLESYHISVVQLVGRVLLSQDLLKLDSPKRVVRAARRRKWFFIGVNTCSVERPVLS